MQNNSQLVSVSLRARYNFYHYRLHSWLTAVVQGTTGIILVTGTANERHLHTHSDRLFLNTLRPRQNGRHFPDDIFKCFILSENVWISIKISLMFIPNGPIRSGDNAWFLPQPPGSLVMWGTEWPKSNIVIQGKYFLWTMTSNSLTENEEHDIPSQILKTIFGLHASVIF